MIIDYDYHRLYSQMKANPDIVRNAITCIKRDKLRAISMSILELIEVDSRALGSSCWSIPKSTRDFMTAIEPRMSSEEVYEKKKRNYRRYIEDLEYGNVLHSFGIRDMTSYCFEPFCFSWTDCNRSTVSMFPGSLLRIIDSMDSLFSNFMLMSSGRNITMDMLYDRFVNMLNEKRSHLHSSIHKRVPALNRDNYRSYVSDMRSSLESMDLLEGMKYVDFDLDLLPATVYMYGLPPEEGEFHELIPRKINPRPKNAESTYSRSFEFENEMSIIGKMPTVDLDLADNPLHLLDMVERKLRDFNWGSGDKRLFSDYSREIEAAHKVWSGLKQFDMRDNQSILRLCSWFASTRKKIDTSSPILLELFGSLGIFIKEKPIVREEYEQDENIVGHMSRMFSLYDTQRAVQEAFLIYGFAITYAYMKVKYGTERAKEEMEAAVYGIELMQKKNPEKARLKLEKMAMATAKNIYKMGPLKTDAETTVSKLNRLLSNAGIFISGKDMDSTPTTSLKIYWTFVESHI